MALQEALAKLEALGSETMRAQKRRSGAGGDPFGVKPVVRRQGPAGR